jgi:hypothetical protein
MTQDAVFRLGPFSVDEVGRLSPAGQDDIPAFRLRWRDRVVYVRMAHGPADGSAPGSLALQTIMGRVPSTAQRRAARHGTAMRQQAFTMLRGLPAALPSRWRMRLLADHRIGLEAELKLDMPTSAAALVTELSLFLLELSPYLDLLDEAGMAAPASGATDALGMAKS